MPTTTKSQAVDLPVGVRTPLEHAVALEGLHAGRRGASDAVVGVEVAVHRADLGAEHPLERQRRRLDDGDLQAALARGGGDLGADPARADTTSAAAARRAARASASQSATVRR